MADQTAATLAASDQTESAEQTGPRAMDDAEWIAKIRKDIPDWQTKGRTELIDAVQTIVGCGRSRGIRLRDLAWPSLATDRTDRTDRKPAPVRRPRPAQAEPKPATRTEPAELTSAEVDRIIAEFYGAEQTERPNVSIAEAPDWAEVAADPAVEQTADSEAPGRSGGSESADQTPPAASPAKPVRSWPILILILPAFVAIWSGWVGLGELTGFGVVHPLPGIWDSFSLNTAITLPIGVETYAAFALRVWLAGAVRGAAQTFAKWSAIGALALGAAGQITYHLLTADDSGMWVITTVVACLPVVVLGMGAALAHLVRSES